MNVYDEIQKSSEPALPPMAEGPEFDLSLRHVDPPSSPEITPVEGTYQGVPTHDLKGNLTYEQGDVLLPTNEAARNVSPTMEPDIRAEAPLTGIFGKESNVYDTIQEHESPEAIAARKNTAVELNRAWHNGLDLPAEWARDISDRAMEGESSAKQFKSAMTGIGEGLKEMAGSPYEKLLKPIGNLAAMPFRALGESDKGRDADAAFIQGADESLTGLAKMTSGLVSYGSGLFSDPKEAAYRDGLRQHEMSKNQAAHKQWITGNIGDPDNAPNTKEFSGMLAQLPVLEFGGPAFKLLERGIGSASKYAVEKAIPYAAGRTLQGASHAIPVGVAAGTFAAHPSYYGAIGAGAVLAARYGGKVPSGLSLRGIGKTLVAAPMKAIDRWGEKLVGMSKAPEVYDMYLKGADSEIASMNTTIGKLKQDFAGKIDNLDVPGFSRAGMNKQELQLRDLMDKRDAMLVKRQSLAKNAILHQHLSNAMQTGLNVAGLTTIPATGYAGLASLAAQPEDAEATAKESTEGGMAFMAPLSVFGARGARLTALGDSLARDGRARMKSDADHAEGYNLLSSKDKRQIDIANGVFGKAGKRISPLTDEAFAKVLEDSGAAVQRDAKGDPVNLQAAYVDPAGNGYVRASRMMAKDHEITHMFDRVAGNVATEAYKNALGAASDPKLAAATKTFFDTYMDRMRKSDPSYDNLSDDAIHAEAAAELGRYILQSTPLENLYGGGTIIDTLQRKIGRMTDRIKRGDSIRTIPGLNAPFTTAQLGDVTDAFYKAGKGLSLGEIIEPKTGEPIKFQEPVGMRDDLRKGLEQVNVKDDAAEGAINEAFQHMAENAEPVDLQRAFWYAKRIADGKPPQPTDAEIQRVVRQKIQQGMDPQDAFLAAAVEVGGPRPAPRPLEVKLPMSQDRGFFSPDFYSPTAKVVDQKLPERAPAKQALAILAGGNKAEVEWSGAKDWVEAHGDKPVNKQDLLKFLNEGLPQIKETKLGSFDPEDQQAVADNFNAGRWREQPEPPELAGLRRQLEDFEYDATHADDIHEQRRADQAIRNITARIEDLEAGTEPYNPDLNKETHYDNPALNLPGGTNYRELLWQLPTSKEKLSKPPNYDIVPVDPEQKHLLDAGITHQAKVLVDDAGGGFNVFSGTEQQVKDYVAGKSVPKTFVEQLPPDQIHTSTHFEGQYPNTAVHARVDDRVDPVTGGKMMLAQELQSDWGQAIRKEGVKSQEPPRWKDNGDGTWDTTNMYPGAIRVTQTPDGKFRLHGESGAYSYDSKFDTLKEAQDTVRSKSPDTGAPDMPFKGNLWKKLGLRQLIKHAVEGGYDSLGWTTGEQQAARYDLSKRAQAIQIDKLAGGDYDIHVLPTNATEFQTLGNNVPANQLDNYVGKEVASKAREGQTNFTGLDLSVGGAGMKGFYDKELVNIANDIGKKFGARVEDAKINTDIQAAGFQEFHDWMKQKGYKENTLSEWEKQSSPKVDEFFNERQAGDTVHRLPITPELKASVMEHGQPMFMPDYHPEAINPDTPAAYRTPDGKIHVGTWHPDAFSNMTAAYPPDQLGKWMKQFGMDKYLERGFVNNKNEFKTPEEATQIALARKQMTPADVRKMMGAGFQYGNRGGLESLAFREAQGKEHPPFVPGKFPKRGQAMPEVNDISGAANEYNKTRGMPPVMHEVRERPKNAADIADAFDLMRHAPNDPAVKKSYQAFKDEVKREWDYATKKLGIKIEPTDADPYGFLGEGIAPHQAVIDDVVNNKHLNVFRGGNELLPGHPMSEIDPQTGENYNTMFRAVHDIFGHVAGEHPFDEAGEESAWARHKQMFPKEAVPAMTSETRGQTSWFFNRKPIREGFEQPGKFAEQKAGLLPESAQYMPEVNVGLHVGGEEKLTIKDIADALEATGVKVTKASEQRKEGFEPTGVFTLSRALTPEEGHAVSEALGQDAIAQHQMGGQGNLFGPRTEGYGAEANIPGSGFDPSQFLTHDGKVLSDTLNRLPERTGASGIWDRMTVDPDFNGGNLKDIAKEIGVPDDKRFWRQKPADRQKITDYFKGNGMAQFMPDSHPDAIKEPAFRAEDGEVISAPVGYHSMIPLTKEQGRKRLTAGFVTNKHTPETPDFLDRFQALDRARERNQLAKWAQDPRGWAESNIDEALHAPDVENAGVDWQYMPEWYLGDSDGGTIRGEKDFGEAHESLKYNNRQWRYDPDQNEVLWWDRPSDKDKEGVDQWLSKRAIYPKRHIDMLHGHPKGLTGLEGGPPQFMPDIEKARSIAEEAHKDPESKFIWKNYGELPSLLIDDQGKYKNPPPEAYRSHEFNRVDSVAKLVKDELKPAAYLSRVFEDTPIKVADLRELGIDEPTIQLVRNLSRRPNEDYSHYIDRVKGNPDARDIKVADLMQKLKDQPNDKQSIGALNQLIPDDNQLINALSSDKVPKIGAARDLPAGTPVSLRIDIPAYNKTGDYAVTIHDRNIGKALGYDGIATVNNPTMYVQEKGAQKVQQGMAKYPMAAINGEFNPSRTFPNDIGDYKMVGFNPVKHSYFYDKATGEPAIGGDKAISAGNTVFVKNPVYGNPAGFLYMPDSMEAIDRAALRRKSDGEIITGNQNDTHFMIPNTTKGVDDYLGMNGHNLYDEGFVDRNGKWYDRGPALDQMKKMGQLPPAHQSEYAGEANVTDLRKARAIGGVFMPDPHPEAVKESAFRMPDGKIWTGTLHADAEDKMVKYYYKYGNKDQFNQWMADHNYESGFVDNRGKFLNRQQALNRALEHNQIGEGHAQDMLANQDNVPEIDKGLEAYNFRDAKLGTYMPDTPEAAVDQTKSSAKQYPEALPLEWKKDKQGNVRMYDVKDKKTKKVIGQEAQPAMMTYNLDEQPVSLDAAGSVKDKGERLDLMTDAASNKLVDFYNEVKDNPEAMQAKGWYRELRDRLLHKLGGDEKDLILFTRLLAATSPNTNPGVNFGFTLDVWNKFNKGDYDGIIEKYKQALQDKQQGILKLKNGKDVVSADDFETYVNQHQLIPYRDNGKRPGMHSLRVMDTLSDHFDRIKGLKINQFAHNLAQTDLKATIDLWAARTLHRVLNDGNTGRWRIQPMNEAGIKPQDFAFGQEAFGKAADKLGVSSDDLQAILWFAEKLHYDKMGWSNYLDKGDFRPLVDRMTPSEGNKQFSLSNLEPPK